jgi:hypothetical protein
MPGRGSAPIPSIRVALWRWRDFMRVIIAAQFSNETETVIQH